jgi:hypothetical protein
MLYQALVDCLVKNSRDLIDIRNFLLIDDSHDCVGPTGRLTKADMTKLITESVALIYTTLRAIFRFQIYFRPTSYAKFTIPVIGVIYT